MVTKLKTTKDPGEKTDIKENTGKVITNLGQLIFGTLFLGSVLRGEIPHYIMLIAGFIGAGIFIWVGLLLSAKKQKDKED
jgi:putative Mn2+ efflux pump MntP